MSRSSLLYRARSMASSNAPPVPPVVDQIRPHWFTNPPPELSALNEAVIAERSKAPKFMDIGMPKYREIRHAEFEHGDENFILDVSVPGECDQPHINCRLFFPEVKEHAQPRGALLHLHGGGFVTGSAMGQSDARLLRHAKNCNLVVVSVDYRLSPENRHPAAILDCMGAAAWLTSDQGRSTSRISRDAPLMVVGESAGGYLAAAMLTRLRDLKRGPVFAAAALTYGWFDFSETPCVRNWGERRLMSTREELRWFRDCYLGPYFPEEQLRCPDVSPLYADLRGLPPALFSVGTEDALLDDTTFMYMRWLTCGNEATLRLYPGAAHGFGHFGPHQHTEQGKQALEAIEAFYNLHLDRA